MRDALAQLHQAGLDAAEAFAEFLHVPVQAGSQTANILVQAGSQTRLQAANISVQAGSQTRRQAANISVQAGSQALLQAANISIQAGSQARLQATNVSIQTGFQTAQVGVEPRMNPAVTVQGQRTQRDADTNDGPELGSHGGSLLPAATC